MGIIQNVKNYFKASEAAPVVNKQEDIEESISYGLTDSDEFLYTPILGSVEPTDQWTQADARRQRLLSRNFYFRHVLGGSLADMLVARALGAGAQYKASSADVQAEVDRYINDPDNNLDTYLKLYATELLVYGELFFPIFLTPANADVRMGYLRQDQVENVIWARGDAKKPIAVIQSPIVYNIEDLASYDSARRLWIIPQVAVEHDNHYPPHPALTSSDDPHTVIAENGLPVTLPIGSDGNVLPEITHALNGSDVKVAGYCFYHRTHCLVSGRGHSIYERINDYLKAGDDFIFNQLKNAILQMAFVWDVTMEGANEGDIRKRKQMQSRPPKPGSLNIHNEKEKWSAVSPNLPSASSMREIDQAHLKRMGLAVGLPPHEIGAEEHSNRATAQESRSISINRAKGYQREIAAMVGAWLAYQIDQKVYVGQLSEDIDRHVEIVLPELDVRDASSEASTLKDAVTALTLAIDSNLARPEDARAFLYNIMGMDAPTDEEWEEEQQEKADSQQEEIISKANDKFKQIMNQTQPGASFSNP